MAQAEALYCRCLESNPADANALYFLAGLRQQMNAHAQAIDLFEQVLLIAARQAPMGSTVGVERRAKTWLNKGVSHKALGDLRLAQDCFEQALALQPDFAIAHYNLGVVLSQSGQFGRALASYERAIVLRPQYARAHANQGAALAALNRYEDALRSCERALRLQPDLIEAQRNRAAALSALQRHPEALAWCDHALSAAPHDAELLATKANCLLSFERYEEALACADRALSNKADDVAALGHRGAALTALHRHEEAIASCNRALALQPTHAQALGNKGHALIGLGRTEEALACFGAAVAVDPSNAATVCNHGIAQLSLGRYHRDAWQNYEARWRLATAEPYRHAELPRWQGHESLVGKSLLVWCEQGYGDTLQFCRFLPELAQRGARIVFEVPAPLRTLLTTLKGGALLCDLGTTIDQHCDFQIPLLGLPLALDTRLETIPACVPYLSAEPSKRFSWEQRLGPRRPGQARIGVACSGFSGRASLRPRAVPLYEFAPLYERACLFLLQKDLRGEDEGALRASPIRDLRSELHDFSDTAALIDCMDLVISVDTAVAHLAGALGKPLHLLLPAAADWRWMHGSHDSPWYPTACLHRQQRHGKWSELIEQVVAQLSTRLVPVG